MIYWGQEAYKNLDALHGEMQDPRTVASVFNKFDHNHDGSEYPRFSPMFCSSICTSVLAAVCF